MKRFIVCLLISVVLSASLLAGPFGVELGWSVGDLARNGIRYEDHKDDHYVAFEPPFAYYYMPNYYADYDQDGIYCVSCFTNTIQTQKDGTELWTYYKGIQEDFNALYGLPYMIVDYYASDALRNQPQNFTLGLVNGAIKILTVWFIDMYVIMMDIYAYSETEGDICCEVWEYSKIASYLGDLKNEYTVIYPQTKADIPW
ncbi:MAG: hypothetical protein J5785_01100 [Spirochaetales bacterium]|nr:hypothetical protein [Spirochaetales bacterium]